LTEGSSLHTYRCWTLHAIADHTRRCVCVCGSALHGQCQRLIDHVQLLEDYFIVENFTVCVYTVYRYSAR